jgi:hypothetical protein
MGAVGEGEAKVNGAWPHSCEEDKVRKSENDGFFREGSYTSEPPQVDENQGVAEGDVGKTGPMG